MSTIRKREGFAGQRAIVLPRKILEMCAATAPVNSLFVTDIGYYPNASHHYRERPQGISQHIIIYCVEGKGWLEIPDGSYQVTPNQFIVIPANMPHKYGADDDDPWSIYWAHFKGSLAASHVSNITSELKTFVIYSPFVEERVRIFDSIYKALESGYSVDNLTYSSLAFSYFIALLMYADKFASSNTSADKDPVEMSIRYMQEHLSNPLMLDTVASSVNLSVSHYSSIFRKKTGYSPIEYFNHLKIQHACQYLQFTTLRISEIGQKLGIDDPYYFSRMFTKVMGLSPVEYRKKKH